MSKQTTLDKLNSFIDAQSPKLATFLHKQINTQQNAVHTQNCVRQSSKASFLRATSRNGNRITANSSLTITRRLLKRQ